MIANTRMASVGLGGHEWKVWGANFLAHAVVATAAYLWMVRRVPARSTETAAAISAFTRAQLLTVSVISAWIAAVVGFSAPPGLAAFAAVDSADRGARRR